MSEETEIRLTSDITVRPIDQMGGDLSIIRAARVSAVGADCLDDSDKESPDAQAGFISYLMKMRHGSPFEASCLQFFVHAPAVIWWEAVRHRVGVSPNLESGRYHELQPVFYVPPRERPMMVPASGYTPARPHYEPAEANEYAATVNALEHAYRSAWSSYRIMLGWGVAPEVARLALGFGVYYSGWLTFNPRSLMHFLALRVHDERAKYVSYPQWEIEVVARAFERVFSEGWPLTYAAFCKHGRVGP